MNNMVKIFKSRKELHEYVERLQKTSNWREKGDSIISNVAGFYVKITFKPETPDGVQWYGIVNIERKNFTTVVPFDFEISHVNRLVIGLFKLFEEYENNIPRDIR